jgi:hypothetical protein
MWRGVRRCGRLVLGSLQKSLQYPEWPGDFEKGA